MDAWNSGNYSNVLKVIPWDDLPSHLQPFSDAIVETYGRATDIASGGLEAPKNLGLRFDINNPRLRKYIDRHTGELIQDIQAASQRVVQTAVKRSFTHAMTPRQVSNYIKDSIVLDERRENALANYRNTLEGEKSYTPERVDSMVDRYADRLLDQRSMAIARTETRLATNQGQLSVWQQAADEGLINGKKVGKTWIVDGNPCEICEPMDGITVGLDEMWSLEDGRIVNVPTETHPHCMCGMELDYEYQEE